MEGNDQIFSSFVVSVSQRYHSSSWRWTSWVFGFSSVSIELQ